MYGAVALTTLFGATAVGTDAASGSVEIWVRGGIGPGAEKARHERSRRMALHGPVATEVERDDPQYNAVRRYRGVSLSTLLRRYAPPASLDLAILHFANGMAIPLPFRDEAVMKRLDPFVATATAVGGQAKALPLGAFPPIAKKDTQSDPRPIRFSGNKIVVAERWHPDVPAGRESGFSPWLHADSLVGVELVASRSYHAQFDVGGDASVRRGLTIFRENCQFCHRIGDVGATFGWDLVTATRDDSYRESAAHLYHNVSFKPRNAPELGLMMPPLGFLTEEDAGYMLAWLEAVASQPLPRYQPPRQGRRMETR